MEWVQFILGAACIISGIAVACIATIGVYRFHFVLNRMHAAAMNDTLAIFLVLFGLIILNGLNFTSLKLFIIICFFWIASPVSSHLIAKLEVTTNPENAKLEIETNSKNAKLEVATNPEKWKEECEVEEDVNF